MNKYFTANEAKAAVSLFNKSNEPLSEYEESVLSGIILNRIIDASHIGKDKIDMGSNFFTHKILRELVNLGYDWTSSKEDNLITITIMWNE